MIEFTAHAKARSQQRNIPPFIVEVVEEFGRVKKVHGADVYALDKHSRKRIKRYLGDYVYRRIEDLLDIYLVESSDGKLITTAKRYKKIASD